MDRLIDQFSEKQLEYIKERYAAGDTQQELATHFVLARRSMMKICKALGLHKDHSQAQKSRFDGDFVEAVLRERTSGKTIEVIEVLTGHSKSAVARVLKKHGDPIPAVVSGIDEVRLCSDYSSGATFHDLAKQHNITTYMVRQVLVNHNVEIRKPIISGGSVAFVAPELPKFVDSAEWFRSAYSKCGVPSIASFLGRSPYYVRSKLRHYHIETISISKRLTTIDRDGVVASYNELGSMSKVAKRHQCTIGAVENVLIERGIATTTTSEMFTGAGNPFFGQKHGEETKVACAAVGTYHGNKFWSDHPEYIEVVREKQKALWSDLDRRRQDSLCISKLRQKGRCGARKGITDTRFGQMAFDSSYELQFIELCEADERVAFLERDFDLIEYEYIQTRHFIPDFRLWLANGDFLVVEIKSDWYARQDKERAKIMAGFGALSDKFMVAADNFDLVVERIGLILEPLDFSFDRVEITEINQQRSSQFYGAFHYLGKSGRGGVTYGGALSGKLVAVASIGTVGRIETAKRLGYDASAVRELTRFCIHPEFHKQNFASWFLSRATRNFKAANHGVSALVSFADPMHGHTGTIYRAAGWEPDGESKPSYHYIDSSALVIHKKTVYERAVAVGMTEGAYAISRRLQMVSEPPKSRFKLIINA